MFLLDLYEHSDPKVLYNIINMTTFRLNPIPLQTEKNRTKVDSEYFNFLLCFLYTF